MVISTNYCQQEKDSLFRCYVINDKKGTFCKLPKQVGAYQTILIKYPDGTSQESYTLLQSSGIIVKIPAQYAHQWIEIHLLHRRV